MTDEDAPEPNPFMVNRATALRFGRRVDLVLTIIVLVVALAFIAMLGSLPARATIFPWFITCSMVLVVGCYAYGNWRDRARWDAHYHPDGRDGPEGGDVGPAFLLAHGRGVLRAIGTFLLVVAMTLLLGPVYAIPLFVGVYLLAVGEGPVLGVLSALGFWAVIHFGFGEAMHIRLPTGILLDYFD